MWADKIVFKHNTCRDKYGESTELESNQINLYIVTTRKCNAHCKFCDFTSGKSDVDLNIFEKRLNEILEVCDIGTIHFTGGETTLEAYKIEQMLKIIKQRDSSISTSVNTNGTLLVELSNLDTLDNIALSRHHYSDQKNNEIFGTTFVPTTKDIWNYGDIDKIHLSCNLIKGYIDSFREVINYLEFASQVGVIDVGFVSLMKVNEYCKEHFVDFENFNIKLSDRLIKNRHFCNIDDCTGKVCCKCENYLYRANNNMIISMYHRYAIRNNEIADYLVYEDNHIKQGFSGKVINY